MSEDEGVRLGVVALSRICWIREESYKLPNTGGTHQSGSLYVYELRKLVRALFRAELREAEAALACIESMLPSPALELVLPRECKGLAYAPLTRNEKFYIAEHVVFQVSTSVLFR